MNEPSVIQTTAAEHAAVKEQVVDLCLKNMILIAHHIPTVEEQAAYIRGVNEGWGFATLAVLREGNCRFEREE